MGKNTITLVKQKWSFVVGAYVRVLGVDRFIMEKGIDPIPS